jgi:hypothetical protein
VPGRKKEVLPFTFCTLCMNDATSSETFICTPQNGSTFCKTTILLEFVFQLMFTTGR